MVKLTKPLLLGTILCVILLAGIIVYALLQQAKTAAVVYHSPTPYPTTNLSSSWQTYQNTSAGFSLSYPANWVKEEPNDNRTDFGRISLDAAEGSLEVDWTTEPSVADVSCPQGEKSGGAEAIGMEPIQLSGETLTGCHLVSTIGWKGQSWTIGKVLSPRKVFLILVEVNEPVQQNKGIIFKALSTLKLGK